MPSRDVHLGLFLSEQLPVEVILIQEADNVPPHASVSCFLASASVSVPPAGGGTTGGGTTGGGTTGGGVVTIACSHVGGVFHAATGLFAAKVLIIESTISQPRNAIKIPINAFQIMVLPCSTFEAFPALISQRIPP